MTATSKLACRDAYGETLLELGAINPDIVVLDADLAGSTRTSFFGRSFPDRFFNMGISEQDMIGTAAGLANVGKTVFASSFAMFASGRPWEIIRNSVCYPKLNVKIVASHAGITVGEDGASHQALEDVAIMRVIPNMKVFVPADYYETKEIIRYVASFKGPAYVRFSRSTSPVVFNVDYKFNPEKYPVVTEGKDVAILATGIMVAEAIKAAEILKKQKVSAAVINIHTLKPLIKSQMKEITEKYPCLVTVEEHNIIGGLFGTVAEEAAKVKPIPIEPVGVNDVFGESGTPECLLEKYNLTPDAIVQAVQKVLKRKKQ